MLNRLFKFVFSRSGTVKDVKRLRPRHDGKEWYQLPNERRHTHPLSANRQQTTNQDDQRPYSTSDINTQTAENQDRETLGYYGDARGQTIDMTSEHTYVNVNANGDIQTHGPSEFHNFHDITPTYSKPTYHRRERYWETQDKTEQVLMAHSDLLYVGEMAGDGGAADDNVYSGRTSPPGNSNCLRVDGVRTHGHSHYQNISSLRMCTCSLCTDDDNTPTPSPSVFQPDMTADIDDNTRDRLMASIRTNMPDIENASADAYDFDCALCSSNGINADSFGFCVNCRKFLCVTCCSLHMTDDDTSSHVIFEGCLEDDDASDGNNDVTTIGACAWSCYGGLVADRDECTHL